VEYYRDRLSGVPGIRLCSDQPDVKHNYAYFPVLFDGYKYDRDTVFAKLGEQGITARKYFYPLTNNIECYTDLPSAKVEETPVAYYISERVLTLPLYADLSKEDIDRICDIILN
jgi:dTDP-4-amino-4,6-dideoxygalactose transaminase